MIEIESQILLNSFPYPAMIIGEDRKILAANDAALSAGAEIGGYCWKSFGNAANLSDEHYKVYLENPDHSGIQCVFCRADNCLANEAEENDPLLQSDVGIFDTYWVPISRNTYLHFAIDITEREKSEELLRQSEERLKLVLKGSNDAPWDWDLVSDELYYSPQWWQQIGYIPDEVPADSELWNRLLHPDDKNRVDNLFSDALKSNTETYEVEFRLLHKDGHYVPVLSRGYISRDENNEPIRVTGVNTDLTERKQKEEELLKNQQLLMQMGRISQVGGWLFDFENEILEWTDEVYKIHELESDFVPNVKDALDFYSEESKPLITDAVQRAIENGEPFDLELEINTTKGNRRTVHSLGIPDLEHSRIYGTFQDITERKLNEETIKEVNRRYSHLVNNAKDMIFRISLPEGHYEFVSDASENIFGYAPQDFYDSPLLIKKVIHPDWNDYFTEQWENLIKGRVPNTYEYPIINKSGELRWLNQRNTLICDDQGKPIALEGVVTDVSDIKKAEEKLRESEHKFRTLFDQAADTIFLLKPSPDGPPIIADVNPSGAKLHGYIPSELIGQPLTIIDPFVNHEEIASRIKRIESGEIAQFEVQHLHKNGESLWLGVSSKLIETGSERFYLSTERNITARKKAEKENERLTDRLLLSTRSAQLGIWDWNVRENTMVWDDRMFELYGTTREETPNNIDAWLNGLHPEDKESALAECQAALDGQKDFDTEFRVLHPDGTLKYLKANGLVIMGADGKPDRMLGVNTDITEKRKLQDAQLRSSQLSALGEVAAGVAHEINNPINGVINYAQMLINKNDEDNNANQVLEKIIREGSRIANIVRNLLNFAQKDRGEFSSLDLIDIVAEPINLHSQFFKNDGIHIEVGVPDDLPRIYGNQMQLEQVLLNLLSNARYALNKKFPEPSNEKFIVIEAASVETSAGECVQLSVKDTGCGIPKEHLDKIFNPFYTTKEAGVGTGLGMSVSHELLENHGAKIEVDSQVDKFTVVTITFPIKLQ